MRGKVDGNLFIDGTYRITPAYAGKSIDEVYNVIGYKDHPRLCGEKYFLGMKSEKFNGITPAYAGKRVKSCTGLCRQRDHPRLCGEKQIRTGNYITFHRITPAYAGKSQRL